jgi:hypothetical protein
MALHAHRSGCVSRAREETNAPHATIAASDTELGGAAPARGARDAVIHAHRVRASLQAHEAALRTGLQYRLVGRAAGGRAVRVGYSEFSRRQLVKTRCPCPRVVWFAGFSVRDGGICPWGSISCRNSANVRSFTAIESVYLLSHFLSHTDLNYLDVYFAFIHLLRVATTDSPFPLRSSEFKKESNLRHMNAPMLVFRLTYLDAKFARFS